MCRLLVSTVVIAASVVPLRVVALAAGALGLTGRAARLDAHTAEAPNAAYRIVTGRLRAGDVPYEWSACRSA